MVALGANEDYYYEDFEYLTDEELEERLADKEEYAVEWRLD